MRSSDLKTIVQSNLAECKRQIGLLRQMSSGERALFEHYEELAARVQKMTHEIGAQELVWKNIADECSRREKVRRELASRIAELVKTGQQLSEQIATDNAAESALLPRIEKLIAAFGGANQ